MSSTESEGQTQDSENPNKNPDQDYELLPENHNNFDLSFKLIVIGDSGVGKTCIIRRFVSNEFSDETLSTDGVNYSKKEISFEDKTVQLDLWDTAGQEQYRSLTKIFYKDAAAAILVYDITRKDSFLELKNYWYDQVKETAPKNISKK